VIQVSYLNADIVSAGGRGFDLKELDTMTPAEYWNVNGQVLDFARNTSYYSHLISGLQVLYDFDGPYFTKDNIQELSNQVQRNYSDYESWFGEAFRKAGFEVMFNDQYWNSFNTEMDTRYFALVFHINNLVYQICSKPETDEELPSVYAHAREDGYSWGSLPEYLEYGDYLFRENKKKGAVCVKNSMAYGRSLDYEKVSEEEATVLYQKPSSSLDPEEEKKLQDFMFHWIIEKSIEYDLPIQIHTGYLAGNGNWLENGRPVKLNNLFLEYPEATFILFHGGFPWTGEYASLAKMFPNVYLDLVWLPQISRQKAVQSLNVMLDAVPYNKFFWGGDCHFIEESVGSLEFGKEVVVEVLTGRIERGLLTVAVAREILLRIFRENAVDVFRL
jgi:hypothetical protein